MSLTKYEVFNTVSLTRAAEALNLTQSAISYSISNPNLGFLC
ncbi:helix-turn-helix domain-containing protein [Domibacillus mangrovi]